MWFNLAVAAFCGTLFRFAPLSACILFLLIIIHCYQKQRLIYILGFTAMGLFFYFYSYSEPVADFDWTDTKRGTLTSSLVFTDEQNIDGDYFSGVALIQNQPVRFSYYIKTENEQKKLVSSMPYFRTCSASVELRQPLPNTNGLKFDYAEYLKRQNIHYQATVKNIDWSSCRKVELNIIDQLKLYRVQLADQMMISDRFNMRYVVALTLGDTRYLSTDELDKLKVLGIYHLYAISGSHVALISVQLFFLLKRFYIPLYWCTAAMFLIIPIYTILTGLSPSVIRSSLFILIYMALKRYGINLLDALSLSFLLFLLVEPTAIFDIGFQLSYFISFILIFTSNLYQDRRPISLLVITCLVSQLASIPILLINFNSFQVIGLLTNLLFIPFFTVVMFPLCTIILLWVILLHSLPGWFDYLLKAAFFLNDLMIDIYSLVHLPDIHMANKGAELYLILTLIIFYILLRLKFSVIQFVSYTMALFLLLYCLSVIQSHEEGVTFIDVGQGDSSIVESGGQILVTDTGGQMELPKEEWQKRRKENDAVAFHLHGVLKEKGYQKIDYLLITHPDADHFGEAVHLLRLIHVDYLILNKEAPGHDKYDELLALAKAGDTEIIDSKQIDKIRVGHAVVEFFNTRGSFSEENDSSIISRITLGRRYLLMADAPTDIETSLIAQLCSAEIDVLKVGHHGSKTSTSDELLDCVQPKYAVISAGRNNRFGHPHEEVVNKLTARKIHILNTQSDGKIEFLNTVRTAKRP
ncbi:DNA internalization-related competence protein ComEC/Rec2 [Macrococcus brunensis]|uniref:DNA internalization-related competence protein ComEC/Rec2 n=1 Tax=Macrococcus brunensis TaxID=198483 RepID=UPI001EEFC298|nr:DNA internalization-related competence protein ComEC/Rec2 [Macrococcus brunensis]ULG73481.1 DNA internalization-related competence protein ComEC/Rec2 [Macrococcus brunensis]